MPKYCRYRAGNQAIVDQKNPFRIALVHFYISKKIILSDWNFQVRSYSQKQHPFYSFFSNAQISKSYIYKSLRKYSLDTAKAIYTIHSASEIETSLFHPQASVATRS